MKGVEATATLNTSGSVDATCEATDLLTKGLVAKLEASTASNGGLLSKALATFDFKQELFTAKASYEVYKGDAHAALSTAALAGFTLGGSVDYSAQKGALTKYAAAGQFVQPEFTLCAKVSEAVGKPAGMTFAGSYFHKVSSEMQVGAELSKAMNKSDVALAFGCAYKLDKDTTVKSKVDSDGMLFGSYKAKISPMSTLTLATQIDTVKLAENNHKFGLELKIEPWGLLGRLLPPLPAGYSEQKALFDGRHGRQTVYAGKYCALPKGGLRAHSARPAIHRVVAADAPARRCGEHARDRSEWTLRGSKASKV